MNLKKTNQAVIRIHDEPNPGVFGVAIGPESETGSEGRIVSIAPSDAIDINREARLTLSNSYP